MMSPSPRHIETREDLCRHLQWAIELELSTIPLYLTALFSIEEGKNREVQQLLRSVVMEEMLHMCLAANLLHAVRGNGQGPKVTGTAAPSYPGVLRHSDGIEMRLRSFGPKALKLFCSIEQPAAHEASSQPDHFDTIGQFYAAIAEGFESLGADLFERGVNLGCQVEPHTAYYGGGGQTVVVTDLDTAMLALAEIVAQGEGVDETVWDGDHLLFGERRELAHYYRFDEIVEGRQYRPGDRPHFPSGPPILVDTSAVRHIDPRLRERVESDELDPEIVRLIEICDGTYQEVLASLEAGLNGDQQRLIDAVPLMYQLEYQGRALTKIPIGDGRHAGPLFRAVAT